MFELDSELEHQVRPPAENPILFVPLIDIDAPKGVPGATLAPLPRE